MINHVECMPLRVMPLPQQIYPHTIQHRGERVSLRNHSAQCTDLRPKRQLECGTGTGLANSVLCKLPSAAIFQAGLSFCPPAHIRRNSFALCIPAPPSHLTSQPPDCPAKIRMIRYGPTYAQTRMACICEWVLTAGLLQTPDPAGTLMRCHGPSAVLLNKP
eukprot:SAG31_NODE_5000_length_2808_cov_1.730897_2_plen_161_part_00